MVPSFPNTTQTFIQNQIVGLLDQNQEVTIFSESNRDSETTHEILDEYDLKEHVVYTSDPQSYHDGVRVLIDSLPSLVFDSQLSTRTIFSEFTSGRSAPRRLANLDAVAKRETADVYHAHFGTIGNSHLGLTKAYDVPFVVSFYGRDASQALQAEPDLYNDLFERADAITVLSEDMRSTIVDAGCPKFKIKIQPLSIDTDLFPFKQRTFNNGAVRILTVARFVEKKGLVYALDAVSSLVDDYDIQYTIIGDGERRELIESKIKEHRLEKIVNLRGWQPQSVVADEMADAHLFLLPSVTAESGDKEGTPTVLLEAQSMGLPVVSTYHAGIPEIVKDGESGLLVPERDSEALANALETLMSEPNRWSEMGKWGREHIERNHSIEAVTDNLLELYRSLL